MLTRRPPEGQGLLDSDEHIGPTSYRITNPDNSFRGNVAVASEGTGFWVALPEHPTGLSETGRVWPRRMRLRQFDGNVAHSNDGDGLRVDNGPKPDGTTEVTVNDPRAVPANPGSRELATGIDRFSAWKNRGSGIWTRLLRLEMTKATLADNPMGVTLVNHDSVVRDSLIVGESANRGTPGPYEKAGAGGRSLPRPWEADFPIRGFEFYDGRNGAERVHFEGFTPNGQRPAGAFSYLRFTAFPIDAGNWASGASFGPGVNRVHLEDREAPAAGGGEDGYRTAVFFDADGSVTGSPGHYVTEWTTRSWSTGAAAS
ncbi:MAG TPA: transmembrane domain-containing protein, partial [Actinomycetes bacterium]|nr:transmembrane domain-containing protein [Actinomycetes bacterium]